MVRYPDFLFIGAMKSATTSISEQLGVQPGIFMVSKPKELFFFSQNNIYERGIDWYTSNFEHVPSDELCGEAATTYTQVHRFPETVERMHQHLPNAKLIYLMRHPIDRLISHYMHQVTLRKITVDINEAIYKHPELVKTSQYAMQLKPYFEAFDYNQILPSFFERLKSNSQAELERICTFIGYSGTPHWSDELKVRNVSKERIVKTPLTDFLRRSPVMNPIREYLMPSTVKGWVRKLFTLNMDRPEIAPEQLAYLKSVFDEDLSQLGTWMGVELSCDTFTSVVTTADCTWDAASLKEFCSSAEATAS